MRETVRRGLKFRGLARRRESFTPDAPASARAARRNLFKEMAMAYATVNPATAEQVRVFPEIADADLFDALAAADICYRNDWALRSTKERATVLAGAAAPIRPT